MAESLEAAAIPDKYLGKRWVARAPQRSLICRLPDGWVLAQCSDNNGVLNGMHDGTPDGKSAWDLLVQLHKEGYYDKVKAVIKANIDYDNFIGQLNVDKLNNDFSTWLNEVVK